MGGLLKPLASELRLKFGQIGNMLKKKCKEDAIFSSVSVLCPYVIYTMVRVDY